MKADHNKVQYCPDTSEHKKCQLDILIAVRDFCKANHIQYYLGYGTLLGSVRHKGFIPWDDDIDITMKKDDYDRFVVLFPHNEGKYRVHDLSFEKDFPFYSAKVYDAETIQYEMIDSVKVNIGISIDLFALDYYPATRLKQVIIRSYSKYYNTLLLSKTVANKEDRAAWKRTVLAVLAWCTRGVSAAELYMKLRKKTERFCNEKTNTLWSAVSVYRGDFQPAALFDSSVGMEFEGELFDAPVGYDKVLTNCYGDYMKLPPEEKRVSHHDFEAYMIKEK